MSKVKLALIVIVVAISLAAGFNVANVRQQPVASADDQTAQERAKQLKDWQDQLKAWNAKNAPSASSTTDMATLPNTGPGDILSIFAGTTVAGSVAYQVVVRKKMLRI